MARRNAITPAHRGGNLMEDELDEEKSRQILEDCSLEMKKNVEMVIGMRADCAELELEISAMHANPEMMVKMQKCKKAVEKIEAEKAKIKK